MSEILNDKKVFTLEEVTRSIQKTLSDRYTSAFWVKAEMNKLNYYKHSGHCYPELVEKKEGRVVSQIKAMLWKMDYLRINQQFLQVLNEPLKEGIKILFLARVTFDSTYGLALRILDIDPEFTLGDLEQEKAKSIQLLKEQGLFYQNKGLKMSLLPKRIAVISVETSKGYADFMKVLNENPFGYKFFSMLFPSLLQGEKAVDSIIAQLAQIRKVKEHFDVVAIIRGGGGDVGLSCYNNFYLAREIATFPLPVLSGIGHATNETVVEMISHFNAITPTKMAENLIQYFHNFAVPVQKAQEKIAWLAEQILKDSRLFLHSELKLFKSVTENILLRNNNNLNKVGHSVQNSSLNALHLFEEKLEQNSDFLKKNTPRRMSMENNVLSQIENQIRLLSPDNVLKRGYSITSIKGKAIKDASEMEVGTEVETLFYKGKMTSIVNKIEDKDGK